MMCIQIKKKNSVLHENIMYKNINVMDTDNNCLPRI